MFKLHYKLLFTACFVLLLSKITGQINLVPNFSFENYSLCPTSADQASLAIGWSKCSNTVSSPDYFNACSTSNSVGIPKSYYFYQLDHRNCGAYMGLVTKTTSFNEREHIGIQLSQPLIVGQKYFLSFYTVRGGAYFGGDHLDNPSNNIGLRFSTSAYSSSFPAPIDNFSHLRSLSVVSDTINWVRISGNIIADKPYNYLLVGNFYDDANTSTITQTCSTCQNLYSYYLIDDVCVSTDSMLCNGGVDFLSCFVSIEENKLNNSISLYPNPFNDLLFIDGINADTPFQIEGYNILGQKINIVPKITSKNIELDASNFNSGLYLIRIIHNNIPHEYKLLKN